MIDDLYSVYIYGLSASRFGATHLQWRTGAAGVGGSAAAAQLYFNFVGNMYEGKGYLT